MKAIILAGGKGTRLRPLTLTTPKPLIDVHGITLTEQVINILKKHGVTEVTLSLGYMADKVKEYFEDKKISGVSIDYLIEEEPMGTAAPLMLLKKAGREIKEDFVCVNGDNLFSLDLTKMIEFHKRNHAVATIGLTTVDDVSQFGVFAFDGDRLVDFVEKPKPDEAPSNFINSGYYVFSPKIFNHIEIKDFSQFELDVFPHLARGGMLYGFKDKGQWFDTGTHERYEAVKRDWKDV
ncbi:MAG: nucleotidyltransferase [Candidatus Buchananbacteria bacterium CG10_big_fil_rev_8_21_14_0_10_42_9]|uniref:Nucleotidyltransferase n=1 Tax=Candidatus Buchananbacteria bacterium CG10_big_fil_rev_8_21_14_0_10_42_9 TaxID=1974526 RepID=A0A2H0VZV2_9BACT|nr:MAG: nucleotidyltransferase [Candidatus Buchananbacteria bacterium CG10_big_fil_rev_8_21_14_0_10_42_9]